MDENNTVSYVVGPITRLVWTDDPLADLYGENHLSRNNENDADEPIIIEAGNE